MDKQKTIAWIKTSIISALGGGITSAIAAACDPSKYVFPRDLGSGKLWPYFFTGAGLMFVGMLLRSPLGQSAMSAYREAQQQAKEDAAMLDKVKEDLLAGSKSPPPDKPKP